MDLGSIGGLLSGLLSGDKLRQVGTLVGFEHGCNSIADDANMATVLQQIATALGLELDQAKALLKGLGDIAHGAARGGIL